VKRAALVDMGVCTQTFSSVSTLLCTETAIIVDALSAIIAMFTIINFVKVYNILVACNKNTLTK